VWAYLLALLAAVGATVVLLVALLLKYLPHDYLAKAGLVCHTAASCAVALPVWALPALPLLVGGALLGVGVYGVASLCAQLGCSSALRAALQHVPAAAARLHLSPRLEGRVIVVRERRLVSYTIGFLRPRVVISDGLLDTLDADEIQAVLSHEEGHLAGRDNLLILVARTLAHAFVLVPGVRFSYARFRRALELAADSYARRTTGDPLVVASSLQKFARRLIVPGSDPLVTAAFADEGHVVERIQGLLGEEPTYRWRRWFAAAALLLVLVFGTFAGSALAFTDVGFGPSGDCGSGHEAVSAVSSAPAGLGVGKAG
jgi:Zn-dependent protease with chaperone function